MSADPRPRVLALLGPTASGKTALAVQLAQRFGGEVVSLDSALIYREMNIGTAKPSIEEQDGITHHLMDLIAPTQAYSAARYRADALRMIADVQSRGVLPMLAGGTMLYFKALIQGLADLPQADAATRAAIEDDARIHGWPALHARLAQQDPATAARLKPNDSQRIARALEVIALTGRPMSELLAAPDTAQAANLPFKLHTVALEPSDRAVLHARIAERFARMLDAGLIEELRSLRERYALHPDLPAMRCVGYRQAWQFIDGAISAEQLLETGIAATRQLAKRQLTWLRSLPIDARFDCLRPDLAAAVTKHIEETLQ